MAEDEDRLRRIERRLDRIEEQLGLAPASAPPTAPDASGSRPPAPPTDATPPPLAPPPRATDPAPAPARSAMASSALDPTRLMALAASAAFVLATGYFVKLVYDAGWLTPARQVGLAALAGLGLIAGGLAFARVDRLYAAYLPAVGVVVLYLAVFTGHTYYGFFGLLPALAAVAITTLTAIWLGRRFEHGLYALLAVVGTYATPLLIESTRADVVDLVVYFSAWGLLFSFVALQEGRRAPYLLALFFALIGFDVAFRMTDESRWAWAATYQFAQFLVFSATAVVFSVRHRAPMQRSEAAVHGVALFYFYAVEFILLKEHAPSLAPWLAMASVAVVLALYRFARDRIGDPAAMRAGALLASSYASVVTAHIGYFELMPDGWHAWAGLLFPLALALSRSRLARPDGAALPVLAVGALLFVASFLRALLATEARTEVPFPELLLLLYAGALYLAYGIFRSRSESFRSAPLPLYAGHVALLTASVRILEGALAISIAWAITAIVLLLYAVRRGDRMVGQSSLVIFSASGLKVLLHDLSDSAPIVRVFVLVVLAASLYAGGWLYQQLGEGDERLHPDPTVNAQLNLIRRLAAEGRTDAALATELEARGVECLEPGGRWHAALVGRIREDYGFEADRRDASGGAPARAAAAGTDEGGLT